MEKDSDRHLENAKPNTDPGTQLQKGEMTFLQGLADLERMEGPWIDGMTTGDPEVAATTMRLLLAHLEWNSKRLLGAMVLDRIADLASANPGGLFLCDSYTKLTSKLGLKESANTFAGPAEDVQEVCAPHSITLVVLHHSGHSRQGEGAVAASRGNTALPAAFSQVINMAWFKRKESKTDKRVLLETEGREEDLQLLILQNTGGWTLEGDASEQLEALFKQEQEDKLSDAMADVLELCRERWRELKRTTRKDVVQHCDSF